MPIIEGTEPKGVLVHRQQGNAALWRQEGTLSYLQRSFSYVRFFAFAELWCAARQPHGGTRNMPLEVLLQSRRG